MLVSVVIPCYNVEAYIEECLQSVLNQTHEKLEIICVENGSKDNTPGRLQQLKENYTGQKKITVLHEPTPGANAARNQGLEIAEGKWIQFLDADDLLEPRKIEHQLLLLQQKDEARLGFVAGAFKRRNLDAQKEIIVTNLSEDQLSAPFINSCGNTCSNLWKKEALTAIGGWNASIRSSQETDLMLKLVTSGWKFILDSIPHTIIRERQSGQISQMEPAKRLKQYIDVRLEYMSTLQKNAGSDFMRLKNIFYDFLMVSIIELGKHDKNAAKEYYTRYIRNNWQTAGSYGFSRMKHLLIKLLGFPVFLSITGK